MQNPGNVGSMRQHKQTIEDKIEMTAGFRDTDLGHLYTMYKDHPPLAQRPIWTGIYPKKSNQQVSQLEF